jgi:hypothetical protein
MTTLIDFILDLFRSPEAASSFVVDPDGALRDAGLPNVTAAQLASVAATAAPAGYALGGGDPIVGLQRAVADHHNLAQSFASPFSPQTTWAPDNTWAPQTTFAPNTNTDLASHNNVPIASPTQDAGANAQNGAFNLGFGDITLGDKTSNTATNGGVVVDGNNHGDIVSGDGAVLGNNNDVNNGDVLAGSGSHVAVGGRGNEMTDSSQHAGGDVVSGNSGAVIKGNDLSGGDGGGSHGGGSLLGIGSGNSAGGDGGHAGSIIVSDSHANSGTQTTIGGDSGSHNPVDDSTHTSVTNETTTTSHTSVDDHSSSYESNIGSGNDTALGSGNHTDTSLFSGNHTGIDTSLASGNHTDVSPHTDVASHDAGAFHGF